MKANYKKLADIQNDVKRTELEEFLKFDSGDRYGFFKCEECGKEICNEYNLKRHKAFAHGIQPNNVHHCEKCPLFFSTQISLEKHITSKHNPN